MPGGVSFCVGRQQRALTGAETATNPHLLAQHQTYTLIHLVYLTTPEPSDAINQSFATTHNVENLT